MKWTETVRTMYLVRRLQLLEREVIENALRPIGLTAGQYTALSMLGRRDGLSSAQLARRFGVAPQSMTDIIKALEDKRLISRHEAESNQRILRIKLTGAGRKCVDICEALVDRAEGQLFAALDRAELTILRQLLGKLVEQHSGDDTDCASDQVTRKTASKG